MMENQTFEEKPKWLNSQPKVDTWGSLVKPRYDDPKFEESLKENDTAFIDAFNSIKEELAQQWYTLSHEWSWWVTKGEKVNNMEYQDIYISHSFRPEEKTMIWSILPEWDIHLWANKSAIKIYKEINKMVEEYMLQPRLMAKSE